jgi:hypothetical protein
MALFDNALWDTIGKTGELPPVRVGVDKGTIVNIAVAVVIVTMLIILVIYLIKKKA